MADNKKQNGLIIRGQGMMENNNKDGKFIVIAAGSGQPKKQYVEAIQKYLKEHPEQLQNKPKDGLQSQDLSKIIKIIKDDNLTK